MIGTKAVERQTAGWSRLDPTTPHDGSTATASWYPPGTVVRLRSVIAFTGGQEDEAGEVGWQIVGEG